MIALAQIALAQLPTQIDLDRRVTSRFGKRHYCFYFQLTFIFIRERLLLTEQEVCMGES